MGVDEFPWRGNIVVTSPLHARQEWTSFLGEVAERDIMVPLAHNTQLWETQGVATVEIFPPFHPAQVVHREPSRHHSSALHPAAEAQRV